jgi:uncharacterized protein YkwD
MPLVASGGTTFLGRIAGATRGARTLRASPTANPVGRKEKGDTVPRTRTVTATMAAVVLLAIPAPAGARTANERAEAEMVAAINHVRAQHGLYALRRSGSLMDSAGRYSRWLMANDTFRHLSTIQASSRFSLLGEALEWHSGRRFDVRGTINRWMGSVSHRAIVLSPVMRWHGVGATRGRLGATRATIWVLQVGRVHPPGVQLPNVGLP